MKALKKVYEKFSAVYCWIELNFIAAFTIIVGALIIYDVVTRNLGIQGFQWMEELGRATLVITTTIGCSHAARENGHMVMDTLYQVLPTRAAYALKAVAYLICAVLYCYIGYYAVDWCMTLYRIKKSMESVNFPAYVMWVFVSIGMVTMGIRYFIETGKCIRDAAVGKKEFTEVNTKEN